MKTQRGFVSILIIIAIVITASAGGYVLYKDNQKAKEVKEDTNPSLQQVEQKEGNNTITETRDITIEADNTKVNISAPVTTTVNCSTKDCFAPNFSSCASNTTIESDAGFAAFYAQIIGPSTGGCKVTMKYTKNPNPDWVNKELTCTLNNKVEIEKSLEQAFTGIINGSLVCEGPLYTVLKSL